MRPDKKHQFMALAPGEEDPHSGLLHPVTRPPLATKRAVPIWLGLLFRMAQAEAQHIRVPHKCHNIHQRQPQPSGPAFKMAAFSLAVISKQKQ